MQTEHPDEDQQWKVEHRYRAVLQVLDGVPVAQVARMAGASRQSVHTWLRRYQKKDWRGWPTGPAGLAPHRRACPSTWRR